MGDFSTAGLRLLRRLLPRWRTVDSEIADEVGFHLDQRIAELTAGGHSAEAARRVALEEFGDVAAARMEMAAIDQTAADRDRATTTRSDLLDDGRFALRHLRRHPGYSTATVLVLALGFGASVATFGILHDTLIEPLPFRESGRLVHLFETQPGLLGGRSEASWPDFIDWREQARSFTGLEGYDPTNVTVREPSGTAMLRGARVTAGFFQLLGVDAALGRTIVTGEDRPGGSPVVVISHRYWRDRFGSDPRALDSTLTIDRRPFRIVGVLPAAFRFAPVEPADFWLPQNASSDDRAERSNHWVNVIGRLQPGVSISAASNDLATVMARLAAAYPSTNQARTTTVIDLRTEFLGTVKPAVLLVFGAGALLLLVTIGNVASLLVARGLSRQRELQIRSAIGAGRARLARQLGIECLILATAGGAIGLAVAAGLRRGIAAVLPDDIAARIPALDPGGLDGAMVGFGLGIAVLAALLFALFPAVRLTQTALTGSRTTTTRAGHRIRNTLVAAQLALVTVLLGGVGLVGRSVRHLLDEPLGFRPDGVVSTRIAVSGDEYRTGQSLGRFFMSVLARVAQAAQVEPGDVGAVTNLPLRGGGTNTFRLEGAPEPHPGSRPEATTRTVAGNYFDVLGIPIVAGRTFAASDDSLAPPAIVISASLANRLGEGASVLGRKLRFYAFPQVSWEIVGVAGDVRTGRLDDPPPPTVYFWFGQAPDNRMTVVLRNARPGVLASIREVVGSIDPSAAIYDQGLLVDLLDASPALAIRRVILATLASLGAVALGLGIVGLFGVVAGGVVERTREFGIRQALGAGPGRIRGLVLRQGLTLGSAGIVVGMVLYQAAARTLPSLFYRVTPSDPVTLVTVAGGLLAVVMAASWIPSRRATQVDPAVTLRAE